MANPKHLSKLKEGAGTLVRALGQLLQNLRSVSTSAPAGNIRVKPNMVMPGHMALFQTPLRVWDRERRLGPTFVPGHSHRYFPPESTKAGLRGRWNPKRGGPKAVRLNAGTPNFS